MKIEDVLIPKNIGKRFKFNLNGQEIITEVKGYYTCGYQKIALDFIDKIDFEEVEREIDWNKVPKWTKVQVKNDLKEGWVNAYFLEVSPYCNSKYKISFGDKFTNINEKRFDFYGEIRLDISVEIKKEWYKDYIEDEWL